MKYLPALAFLLAAAPCALAKSKAKVNTSVNPVKHLARSNVARNAVPAVARRQASSPSGEFCGTDGKPPFPSCLHTRLQPFEPVN